MENKSISYLNSNVWYRLLKIVFITILLIVFLANNFSIIDGTNGPLGSFLGFPLGGLWPWLFIPLPVIPLLIIDNLVILFIFEAIRRAFYYVAGPGPVSFSKKVVNKNLIEINMVRGNFIGAAIVAIIYTVYILMKPLPTRSQTVLALVVLNALTIVLMAFAFKK